MTGNTVFCAVGEIRDEYILDADAAVIAQATRGRRIGRRLLQLGRTAACLVLVLAACFVSFDWYFGLTATTENVLKTRPAVIGNRLVFYGEERLGDGQTLMLQHRRGELVWQNGPLRVWQPAGREDFAELIFEENDTFVLGRFHSYSILPYAGEVFVPDETWPFWGLLTAAEWAEIDFSPYGFADVLRDIYGAESAEDIVSVRFAKAGDNNTAVGRSIKINTVTLRDAEALNTVWETLAGLAPLAVGEPDSRPQVWRPADVLAEQVRRRVTVTFRSGAELRFRYDPAGGEDGGRLTGLGADYTAMTVEQNQAWIALAGVSFAPTPIPETEPPRGLDATETAVPPPAPSNPAA